MLNQLSAEVSELLKGKPVIAATLNILRRMKPTRQIEAAKFMLATENYSRPFAKALLVATSPAGRRTPRIRPVLGLSADMKDNMQREMERLLHDFSSSENYGGDVLSLVVASGYIAKLIENQAIKSYLNTNHPSILRGFRTIVAAVQLDDSFVEGTPTG